MGRYSALDIAKWGSVGLMVVVTVVLATLLPRPGYHHLRLGYFLLVAVVGWVGAAGALLERLRPTVAGALGLVLLGFWQFTVGLVMLPTAAALFVTAALLRENGRKQG